MTTLHAEIEIYLLDLCDKYDVQVRRIDFEKKRTHANLVNGKVVFSPGDKEVLVIYLDLEVSEEKKDYVNPIVQALEKFLSDKVEFYAVSGNYYVRS